MKRREFNSELLAGVALLAESRRLSATENSSLSATGSIVDVGGIRVGHYTDKRRPTGCTAILFDGGAFAGVDVRGSSAETRSTETMSPLHSTGKTHAIVLAGGSTFGLDAVSGVSRFLEEHGVGLNIGGNIVPQVVGAILFDLRVGNGKIRPDAEAGYRAAAAAVNSPVTEGNVGAGAGATVGKLFGPEFAMKTGLGTASVCLGNSGVRVGALVAVNAVGDIYDPATVKILAGARSADGKGFRNTMKELEKGYGLIIPERWSSNTTLAVVATNASLGKVQVTKIAQMAHDGLARAINPVHTLWDGDTVFAAATGTVKTPVAHSVIGAVAAQVLAQAIVRAAMQAESLPGLPAARDFPSRA